MHIVVIIQLCKTIAAIIYRYIQSISSVIADLNYFQNFEF